MILEIFMVKLYTNRLKEVFKIEEVFIPINDSIKKVFYENSCDFDKTKNTFTFDETNEIKLFPLVTQRTIMESKSHEKVYKIELIKGFYSKEDKDLKISKAGEFLISDNELINIRPFFKKLSTFCYYDINDEKLLKALRKLIYRQASFLELIELIDHIGYSKLGEGEEFFCLGNKLIGKDSIIQKVKLKDSLQQRFSIETEEFIPDKIEDFFKKIIAKISPPIISNVVLDFLFLSTMTTRLTEFGNGDEPKFILVLRGLTQSGKSTLAGALLQTLKIYNNKIMSKFKDTKAAIFDKSKDIVDLPFIVDDFYPTSGKDKTDMTENLKILLRCYGDNDAKKVFNREIELKNLLCITCEELPNNLTPSDFYRLFILDIDKNMLNNVNISELKEAAPILNSILIEYTKWTLAQENFTEKFFKLQKNITKNDLSELSELKFNRWRNAVAWLLAQHKILNKFLTENNISADLLSFEEMKTELIAIVFSMEEKTQTVTPQEIIINAFNENLATQKFKLYEIKHNANRGQTSDVKYINSLGKRLVPPDFLGFYDDYFIYVKSEKLFKLVYDYSKKNNFIFNLNISRLLDILNENNMLNKIYEKGTPRTEAIKVDNLQQRFIKINKDIFSNGGNIYEHKFL